jgi:hypothetical protein
MEFKNYGTVEFEGKKYLLLEEAYISTKELTEYITVMQAIALDKNYEKVMVNWEFTYDENLELDDYDYSIATSVTYL